MHRLQCLTSHRLKLGIFDQAVAIHASGARWIQLRLKEVSIDAWTGVAEKLADFCHRKGVTLVVNDSIEVALASGAHGVHLGKQDGSLREARERLGPKAIVGATVHDEEEARAAIASGVVDYLGIGPFRRSPTKGDFLPALRPHALDSLLAMANRARLPAYVIGGVTPLDVESLINRGAHGVAVCSDLFAGGKVAKNAKALLSACEKALEKAA